MNIELNIGLNVEGGTNTPAAFDARANQAIARLIGCALLETTRYETTYQGPDGDTTEPGLFVRLDTNNLFFAEQTVYFLSVLLDQDCISVYYPALESGRLVGPRSSKWGAFDADFFHRPATVELRAAA